MTAAVTEVRVLDGAPQKRLPKTRVHVTALSSYEAVLDAMRGPSTTHLWVVTVPHRLRDLLRAVSETKRSTLRTTLFSYARPDEKSAVVLESVFANSLLGPAANIPLDQLVEVLSGEHPEDYCVAADWVEDIGSLALWRGDFRLILAPLSEFPAAPAAAPDPNRLSIEDYGQTIRLGDYESAFDAVLYTHDPDFRRRFRKKLWKSERGLGPSIRRLRELRGVRRDEFGVVDAKTVARIERGEVKKPHQATLEAIAAKLAVRVDELASY